METSLNVLLAQLTSGSTNNAQDAELPFGFSDPAYNSQQLKDKWKNGYGKGPAGENNTSDLLKKLNGLKGSMYAGQPTTSMQDGKVMFENDNYNIDINDRGEINIHNKGTDEHYRIWGDPHVDVDGKRAFDFKGDMSFVLDDGTKLTVETTPWKGNNGQTISSKVTISDGNSSYGVHVTGVDDNHLGDLAFEDTQDYGHFLDSMVDDGNYVHENPAGEGFLAVGPDGWTEVDQSVVNFLEGIDEKLGLEDMLADFKDQLPDNPLAAFMMGASMNSSLGDFQNDLGAFDGMKGLSDILDSFIQILESFSSLMQQQSKPFGYMSGLSGIDVSGSYGGNDLLSDFGFKLNFSRR